MGEIYGIVVLCNFDGIWWVYAEWEQGPLLGKALDAVETDRLKFIQLSLTNLECPEFFSRPVDVLR